MAKFNSYIQLHCSRACNEVEEKEESKTILQRATYKFQLEYWRKQQELWPVTNSILYQQFISATDYYY